MVDMRVDSVFGKIQRPNIITLDTRLRQAFDMGDVPNQNYLSLSSKSTAVRNDGKVYDPLTQDEIAIRAKEADDKKRIAEEIAKAEEEEAKRKSAIDYSKPMVLTSSERFGTKDYDLIEDRMNYIIDGVSFTGKQTNTIKRILDTCFQFSSVLLDYGHYVQMGVAEGVIKQYAKDNLNEEQSRVVNGFVHDFCEKRIQDQEKYLSESNVTSDNSEYGLYGNVHQYYNRYTNSEQDRIRASSTIEWLNSHLERKDISEKFRSETIEIFQRQLDTGKFWVSNSATNTELISKLRKTFSDLDYSDNKMIDEALDNYIELMRPVVGLKGSGTNAGEDLQSYSNTWKEKIETLLKLAKGADELNVLV